LETELFELNVIKKIYIINLFYFNASWLYSLKESSMKLNHELDQTKDNLAKETNGLVNNLKADIQKLETGLLEPNVNYIFRKIIFKPHFFFFIGFINKI
jgi:hypothetical protein